MRSQKTIQMVETALMSAVLCVLAPIAVPLPISPVPLSMATFAVYLAAALLGPKKGTISVLIYLLVGMAGLPVFSGFSGGIGILTGPTGGYIIGYLPCAVIIGLLAERGVPMGRKRRLSSSEKCESRRWQQVAWNAFAMMLGTFVCYVFGTAWFLIIMDGSHTLMQAFLICVMPYLAFDMIKICGAAVIVVPVRKIVRRIEQG